MVILQWYKFIFSDKRYLFIDKLMFVGIHVLLLFTILTLFKAIVDFDGVGKYLAVCLFLLTSILGRNIKKLYQKFTLPFDEQYFKQNKMTSEQKELLKVKEKLIDSIQ